MQIKVTWNNSTPVPATGGYKVYKKIDGGAQTLVGTAAAGTNELTDTVSGPTGTHTYTPGVSGINNTGQESAIGWGSDLSFTINEPTPSTPTGVNAAIVG